MADDDDKKAVDAKINNALNLLNAYLRINVDADAGKIIRGENFLAAGRRFNEGTNDYDKRKASPINGIGKLPDNPGDEVYRSIDLQAQTKLNAIFQRDPGLDAAIDNKPLDRAFVREYLNSPAHVADTQIDSSIRTESALLQTLLEKNRGFALGDMHTQDECETLLTRNMAVLKASGVDTIYTEIPIDKEWKELSADELRQIAEKKEYKGVKFYTPKEDAEYFRVENADDVNVERLHMLAAAKEHNIRIVPIDPPGGPARIFDMPFMEHRFASTNFVWTDAIEADRKTLADQGKEDGKFIVFGGAVHFMSVGVRNRRDQNMEVNGFVDEALGIPLIAYDNTDKSTSPAFRVATNPNGPDFYLPGGTDYGKQTTELPLNKEFDPIKDLGIETKIEVPNKIPGTPPGKSPGK